MECVTLANSRVDTDSVIRVPIIVSNSVLDTREETNIPLGLAERSSSLAFVDFSRVMEGKWTSPNAHGQAAGQKIGFSKIFPGDLFSRIFWSTIGNIEQ